MNGTGLPDVDFDVGESYSGLLPISNKTHAPELFFWFFPSTNPKAKNEIVIWLNGGPGCSSLEGFLQGKNDTLHSSRLLLTITFRERTGVVAVWNVQANPQSVVVDQFDQHGLG